MRGFTAKSDGVSVWRANIHCSSEEKREFETYLSRDELAKAELKKLMPEDAKEAIGHGIRAKRAKSGAISFDPVEMEGVHAPGQ